MNSKSSCLFVVNNFYKETFYKKVIFPKKQLSYLNVKRSNILLSTRIIVHKKVPTNYFIMVFNSIVWEYFKEDLYFEEIIELFSFLKNNEDNLLTPRNFVLMRQVLDNLRVFSEYPRSSLQLECFGYHYKNSLNHFISHPQIYQKIYFLTVKNLLKKY